MGARFTTPDGQTRYIVTEGDPDCDGYTRALDTMPPATEAECLPLTYRGTTAFEGEGLAFDSAQTCRPTGAACQDDRGEFTGSSSTCVPSALCGRPCAPDGLGACAGGLAEVASVPYLTCLVAGAYATALPAGYTFQLCNSTIPATSTLPGCSPAPPGAARSSSRRCRCRPGSACSGRTWY